VLTSARVAAILMEFATGNVSVLELARRCGVNEATMRAIVNGQTWRHVAGPRLPRTEIVAMGKRNRVLARRAAAMDRHATAVSNGEFGG
jgi:hypothetical protein